MKINYGSVVSTGSGSAGGCTYSRNRFGPYVRRRAMPVFPGSPQQIIITGALATLVATWKTLSLAQRTNWETFAANSPRLDSLGNTIFLTGQEIFISLNAIRIQVGFAIVTTAPVLFGDALLTPPVLTSVTGATDAVAFTFTNTDPWATAVGGALCLYSSRPQAPSVNFFKGPYRFAGKIDGAAVPPVSPGTLTSAFDYAAGQKFFCLWRAIQANGQIALPIRQSIVAV